MSDPPVVDVLSNERMPEGATMLCHFRLLDGSERRIAVPQKTGEEGFDMLTRFIAYAGGPPAVDQRWEAMQARLAADAVPVPVKKPKRRK